MYRGGIPEHIASHAERKAQQPVTADDVPPMHKKRYEPSEKFWLRAMVFSFTITYAKLLSQIQMVKVKI